MLQGDQKVSVHLMITIQKAGAQRLFDHAVLDSTNITHNIVHQSYISTEVSK